MGEGLGGGDIVDIIPATCFFTLPLIHSHKERGDGVVGDPLEFANC